MPPGTFRASPHPERHAKPCGLLDVADFYRSLLAFVDHAVAERFVRPEHRALVLVDTEPGQLLDAMEAWSPIPPGDKWIDRDALDEVLRPAS
ncbi:MAG: LOG family protein [Actinomycetota bacterium]|nr:LOG family protein [Actinomycetota bacterium]MDA8280025.1 LOG family protein [Actinomycetota bacterium]